MFARSTHCRAPQRKRLTSAFARRLGPLYAILLAAACGGLVSACSDDDRPASPATTQQSQDGTTPGASGAVFDAQNAPAAALTIRTPARPAAPGTAQDASQSTSQAGATASSSLAPPVIHTVD